MDQILLGVGDALAIENVLLIAVGVFTGLLVGAIPGLNGPMAIALALPITFYLSSLSGIAFLIGIMKGGTFGGSVAAILLNTPGSPEAAATAMDGYPLAQKGKGLKAMKMALYSSVFGDSVSDIVLFCVAAPVAVISLKMGPPEMASVLIFALTIIAGLSGKSLIRGLIAATLGGVIGTIGLDPESAVPRMTFGFVQLSDGVSLIPMTIGLLALSEIIVQLEAQILGRAGAAKRLNPFAKEVPRENKVVTWAEWRACFPTTLRSSAIGTGIGALPGVGAVVAGFLGYASAKRASKTPEEFGTGKLEGIAAVEAANSAVSGANLIPLLAIGVPGSLTAAVLIGAFLVHGVQPGPLIFQDHPRLIYGIFAAMVLANIFNFVIGQAGLRFFAFVVSFPNRFIYPAVILCCIAGAYAGANSMFDVAIAFIFAVVGYFMRKLDFSFAAFIIGFALTPQAELYVRQTVILYGDRPMTLLTDHPIVAFFLALTTYSVIRIARYQRKADHARVALREGATSNDAPDLEITVRDRSEP
ncbi:tripartite tricarboxylate transporter permease [Pseudoruegeria sp. HB172150]|uniref:tripartite tricarboxylate transporter permease n=1 Tax=Pseudoruegeria sp. HB172150 TaxID=2721164 RepID=UPI00155224E5|nr:tripartite tricarboxylate transporter permease [Pseudoruegeria sp. HB172150]